MDMSTLDIVLPGASRLQELGVDAAAVPEVRKITRSARTLIDAAAEYHAGEVS
jgi:hypothetical protein